jgi:uncharacterized protein (DUF2252 family)
MSIAALTDAGQPEGGRRPRPSEAHVAGGKALRQKIPREAHAGWKPHKDRPDPLHLLRRSDEGRREDLLPIRYGRMLASPFAFYRGSAGIMAADLANTPATRLRVQACGDCHLLNFGGFATPERNIIFDINDFDETLPAPWEWDVKRLAASFVLAARSNGMSDSRGRDCAVLMANRYRERLRTFSQMNPLRVWYARFDLPEMIRILPKRQEKTLRHRIEKATAASGSELDFPRLTTPVAGRVTIRDQPPLIFHPQEAALPDFEERVERVLARYRMTLSHDRRELFDRYRYVDAAIKVVGVGSVGRRCWIVLMMSEDNHPLFLQFKEAAESVLEPHAGRSAFPHHGQRVVEGQRLMQPASDILLGWVDDEDGRPFYVRQLRDAKLKPLTETYDAQMLGYHAMACGAVLARAHAKASDVRMIAGYLGTSDAFDEAIGDFALAYADQAESDHALLKAAVRKGKIDVLTDA